MTRSPDRRHLLDHQPLITMETSMPKQTERVARMETKAFPPPLHKVRLGFQAADELPPPYPDDLGPEDMFIVIRGVAPVQSVSP